MTALIHNAGGVRLFHGDATTIAAGLEAGSVRSIVTSPPYFGLRDYGEDGQIGAEASLSEYVDRLVALFRELRRVLADDGTLWLNLGDSYSTNVSNNGGYSAKSTLRGDRGVSETEKGRIANDAGARRKLEQHVPSKNLIGVPWRVAFALQDDGWILRSDIIWAKPNPMPESVTDRPTKAHEYLFLFAKKPSYYYDAEAIAEPGLVADRPQRTYPNYAGKGNADRNDDGRGDFIRDVRNKRTVWTVPTVPFPGSHFAVYPPELIRPCIRAGSAIGDTILDPFSGSGTTGMVARQEGRNYIGIDLNREYLDLSLRTRFSQPVLDIWEGGAA